MAATILIRDFADQGRKKTHADRTFLGFVKEGAGLSQIAEPMHARGAWLRAF